MRDTDLLPLVVGQRDALWRHLEVHNGGSRWRRGSQCLRYGLSYCLRARQRLHLHWIDVEHIAGWEREQISQSESKTSTCDWTMRRNMIICSVHFVAKCINNKMPRWKRIAGNLFMQKCWLLLIRHAFWIKSNFRNKILPNHSTWNILLVTDKSLDGHVRKTNLN